MDRGIAIFGVLKGFKDQDARSFSDDESISFCIERTASRGGVIIAEGEGLGTGEASHT